MIPSLALQKALYEELVKGDYSVFELMPSDKRMMPFITFTDLTKETNFTKDNLNRFTFSVTLHGWSMGKSSVVSKEIEEFIYNTAMNFEMNTYNVEFVELSFNTNIKEEETHDRVIFHSVQQFEITISKRGVR